MRKEIKTLVYDEELRLEAYRFEGMSKPFPNHFHDYYVIGLIEKGERRLWCRHQEYAIGPGCILLFNPGDTHACIQTDGGILDYRGFNIATEVMLDLAEEITGKRALPGFSPAVLYDEEVSCYLRPLHDLVMNGSLEFGKEESLLLMLSLLMQRYGQPFEECIPECREEIERACAFMEEHAAERISLDQICREAGLSKSTLLRAFAKSKGVAPYCLLLFGKPPHWQGKKIAGTRHVSHGSGPEDRLFRPKPFHQLLCPLHRRNARRISGYLPKEQRNRRGGAGFSIAGGLSSWQGCVSMAAGTYSRADSPKKYAK